MQKLFLLIPGIQPELYHWPVETGASVGYHSIGISWFDKPAAGGVCYESKWATQTGQTDGHNASAAMATCAHHVMLMRLLGKDDPRVPPNAANFSVDSLNSITGRTEALLQHLVRGGQPQWGQYLNASGKLRWEKVAVAGHSRASGIVAALSKVPSIADVAQRMIMVGGPGLSLSLFLSLFLSLLCVSLYLSLPRCVAPARSMPLRASANAMPIHCRLLHTGET